MGITNYSGTRGRNRGELTTEQLLELAIQKGGAVGDVAQEALDPRKGLLSSVGEKFKHAFTGIIDVMNMPNQIIAGAISKDYTISEALKDNVMLSDVVMGEKQQKDTKTGTVIDAVARFGIDVLGDPTTYIGTGAVKGVFGVVGLTKIAAGERLAKRLNLVTDSEMLASTLKSKALKEGNILGDKEAKSLADKMSKELDIPEAATLDKTRQALPESNIPEALLDKNKKKALSVDGENVLNKFYKLKLDAQRNGVRAITSSQLKDSVKKGKLKDLLISSGKQLTDSQSNVLVTKIMKDTDDAIVDQFINSKLLRGEAEQAMGNLLASKPGLIPVYLDKGGIKFFGKTILSSKRISATTHLIPGMTMMDNALAPIRRLAQAAFDPSKLGLPEEQAIGIISDWKNFSTGAKAIIKTKHLNVMKSLGLSEEEFTIVRKALENRKEPVDQRLKEVWQFLQGIKPEGLHVTPQILQAEGFTRAELRMNMKTARKAGLPVTEITQYYPHMEVREKVSWTNMGKNKVKPSQVNERRFRVFVNEAGEEFAAIKGHGVSPKGNEVVKLKTLEGADVGEVAVTKYSKSTEEGLIMQRLQKAEDKAQGSIKVLKDKIMDSVRSIQSKFIGKTTNEVIAQTEELLGKKLNREAKLALKTLIQKTIPRLEVETMVIDRLRDSYSEGVKLLPQLKELSANDLTDLSNQLTRATGIAADDIAKFKAELKNIKPKKSVVKEGNELLEEAKKYKSAEEFVKAKNPVEYRFIGNKPKNSFDRDTRSIRINLMPDDSVKGKGITREETLNVFKEGHEKGNIDITPSLGIWTKDGDAFMKTLARDGWVERGDFGYQVTDKIKSWKTKSQLTNIWNKAQLEEVSTGIKLSDDTKAVADSMKENLRGKLLQKAENLIDENQLQGILRNFTKAYQADPQGAKGFLDSIIGKEQKIDDIVKELDLTKLGTKEDMKNLIKEERDMFISENGKYFKQMELSVEEGRRLGINWDDNVFRTTLVQSLKTTQFAFDNHALKELAQKFGTTKSTAPSAFREINLPSLKETTNLSDMFVGHKGESLVFHPRVATAIENAYSNINNFDEGIAGIGKAIDDINGIVKASLTTWFPGFHALNAFGNVMLNFLDIGAQVMNPLRHAQTFHLMSLNHKTNALQKVIDVGSFAVKGSKEYEAGIKASEEFGDMMTKTFFKDKHGYNWSFGELKSVISNNAVAFNPNHVGSLDISNSDADDVNEMVEDLFPAKTKGEKAAKLAKKALPISQDFIPTKFSRRFISNPIEEQARLLNFMSNLAESGDVAFAAQRTKQFLFDYQNLTGFERSVMRRVIPFYTFARKNLELQAKALLQTPGRISVQPKLATALGDILSVDNLTEEERAILPEWLQQSYALKVGEKGGETSIIGGFKTPFEAAVLQLMPTTILSAINPLIKLPMESASGTNFFRGKPISEVTNADVFRFAPSIVKDFIGYTEVQGKNKQGEEFTYYSSLRPERMHWLLNLPPTSRVLSTFTNMTNANTSTQVKLLQGLTGFKIDSVNLEVEAQRRENELKSELEKVLKDSGVGYSFDRFVVNK